MPGLRVPCCSGERFLVPAFRRADENRSSKRLSDRKKVFNFVSSGKGGVSPRRRSLNRESGEEPCSESGAVPAAVSLFPCVGRSEQSLSPSGGGKTARGETSQKTCPCSRASMLRVQSGVQVFPGFPEPAFTSRYFLPEEKGRSLFVPAIFTVPHREPRSVGFP